MDFIIDEPNEKQKEFFLADTRFVAYGGARGGGKSWAVREKAILLSVKYPGIVILILRKTMPELEQNHITPLRDLCCTSKNKIADYNETKKTLTFKNGSVILFGYCASDGDLGRYQGNQYDVIFIDEATNFPEEHFSKICPSVRWNGKEKSADYPKRIYLTCNPGGVGHGWVKRLFVDKEYKDNEKPEQYTFIKATVYDNTALLKNDPDYVYSLETLPDGLREAWLHGEWNIFAGQYFTEFDEKIHVISPFSLPSHWKRYITIDYGLDMLAAYWIAVDERKRAYVYKELHEPDLNVSAAAKKILDMTNEPIYMHLAPKDLFSRRQETGKSAADIFEENGISLTKIDNDRISGWLSMKEFLKIEYDLNGNPQTNMRIFSCCSNLIKYLPLLQFDDKKHNDVATKPHLYTHCADSLRYFCSFWISASEMNENRDKKRKLIDMLLPKKNNKKGYLA